ncbi:MAG TPA: OmpH family outer membrane protein [Allosphingosinicella sp.]|jgi:Skp family chaperone for outer membrane proteins
MKNILLGAAMALTLAVPGAALAQRVPAASIVVVERDRVLRDCNACRTAQTQLQALQTQLQQRQQQLGQPIQTEAQSIEQAAAALRNQSGAARTTAETALQGRVQQLRQREQSATQELQRMELNYRSTLANVVQQIDARLNPIITQVMTQRGANLAMDVGATYGHAAALNVTDQVLTQLNAALTTLNVVPLPQQQQPAAAQPGR